MKRWSLLALLALGCSIEPFEPYLVDDGGVATDGGGTDGSTGTEDCLNGVDDDDDGQVDCADPDCVAFTCANVLPSEWSAYGTLDDCASPLVTGNTGLRAEPVTCEDSCSCELPTNPRCEADVRGRATNTCSGAFLSTTLSPGSACADFSAAAEGVDIVSVRVAASCPVGPTDTPLVIDRPEPTTSSRVSLCEQAVGAGCEGAQVCVATTAPRCVTRPGNVACPDGLPHRRLLTTDVADERFCTDCQCGLESGSCTATLEVWSAAGCGGTSTPVSSGGCVDVPTALSASMTGAMPTGVSCGSSGGSARGCVGSSEVATVCCDRSAGPACPTGPGPAMLHQDAPGGAFCIDSTEVTNAQYQAFLDSTPDTSTWAAPCAGEADLTPRSWPRPPEHADRAVFETSYCQAYGYCRWAGKRLCGRVGGGVNTDPGDEEDPAQSEWAYACSAAGALDPSCFDDPWDDDTSPCCEVDGLFRMAGGADEWVASPCEDNDCFYHESADCFDVEDSRRNGGDDAGFRCCADPLP